jgi:gamma-glutamyltranspeptidase/glutathione hydrolase
MRRIALLVFSLATGACGHATSARNGAIRTGADHAGAAEILDWIPAIPARRAAIFPPGWHLPAGQTATTAPHGMVVSNSALASEAGVEIMKRGGNAVDAAVATGFALAVTYPAAGNIGGGGFMVIRMADGRAAALDYREVAPLAATRDMYLDATGKLTDKSIVGALASGVPGAVAGMAEALRKYGTMSLRDVMAPAIRLARDGFVVDSALSGGLEGDSALLVAFAGKDVFFPNGHRLAVGALFKQERLARTLSLIAEQGPQAFYRGEIADSLVAQEKRDGGIITREDLARYTPLWREPVRSTYRGYSLFAMPPSSSGGITMVEALNILETYDSLPSFESAEYKHLLIEAWRRAFIDRNTKLGDPAFVKVPQDELTSKSYARTLRSTIEWGKSSRTPRFNVTGEAMHTTHYSVVDGMGNAVATTTTLNGSYGSGVWIRGGGFFMNNEMDDFAAQPGKPNMFGLVQGESNAVAPGKRMLSAMSPSIVLDPKGQLFLVTGAAGGPTIITGTMQVILNVIDHRMSLADAMRAPRLHHQAWPDSSRFEQGGVTPAALDSLRMMGHFLFPTRALVNVNSIMRVAHGWEGVFEPRSHGGVAGF